MDRLDYDTDSYPFTGVRKVNIPVVASLEKHLDNFFDGTENVKQVVGVTRGKSYVIIEVEGFGDVFDCKFIDDNNEVQRLGSWFFEDAT